VVQQNKSCSSAHYYHVTQLPPDRHVPTSATTKLSTQLQAHHILYDIDQLVQDMASAATKMTNTLFDNRDDKRASLKLQSSYIDHLKALEQIHSLSKMHQSFKLLRLSNAALLVPKF
jgi:hypothetical protein